MNFLHENGIETKIQHPILMTFHTAYKELYHPIHIPIAVKLVKKILCIPNHDKMTDQQVEYVVGKIYNYYLTQISNISKILFTKYSMNNKYSPSKFLK